MAESIKGKWNQPELSSVQRSQFLLCLESRKSTDGELHKAETAALAAQTGDWSTIKEHQHQQPFNNIANNTPHKSTSRKPKRASLKDMTTCFFPAAAGSVSKGENGSDAITLSQRTVPSRIQHRFSSPSKNIATPTFGSTSTAVADTAVTRSGGSPNEVETAAALELENDCLSTEESVGMALNSQDWMSAETNAYLKTDEAKRFKNLMIKGIEASFILKMKP
jgi:hypothetical protein